MGERQLHVRRFWRRDRTFAGGVFLPPEKDRTEDRLTQPLPIARRVYVPLVHGCRPPSLPCVEVGQVVRCGEVIARAKNPPGPGNPTGGADAHASADGVVRAFGVCDTPHQPEVPCVEIETARAAIPHVASALQVATIDELIAHAAGAGIVEPDPSGGRGVLVADRLRDAADRGCRSLIVNAMESEPCVTVDWRILVERTDDVLDGARRLASLLGAEGVSLAVDASKRKMVAQLATKAHGSAVRIVPLVNKYPQGHPALLTLLVLGREIPVGGDALDVGAFVITAGTVAAIESLVRSGMPMTQRPVTVSGDAVERPGNYTIAIGTPIRHVIEHVGLRRPPWGVIAGNPMTGVAIRRLDTVVAKDTTALLLLADETVSGIMRDSALASPGPCTRCGWCLEDCPVGLDPRALLNAAERRMLDRAAALHVHACIGCGLCSYACPARLPLAALIRALRQQVPLPRPRRRGPARQAVRKGASAA